MYEMFSGCNSLIDLDLSSFDTSSVTSMGLLFNNCPDLNKLDISTSDFSLVTNSENTFNSLKRDIIIYVKDDISKDFILGVRSDLTNVQLKEV